MQIFENPFQMKTFQRDLQSAVQQFNGAKEDSYYDAESSLRIMFNNLSSSS